MGSDRPPPPAGAAQPRRLSWDVLRASAVLLVMLYHATWLAPRWHPELASHGVEFAYPVGASVLLVVSGYFAGVSVRRGEPLRWWIGRLCRILPAFWVAVPVTALLTVVFSPADWWSPTWRDVGANLLMLWQWKPQSHPFVDSSYWTLPIQLVGFTAVLVAARRRRGGAVRLLLCGLVVEVALWPVRVYAAAEPFRMVYDGLGLYRMHLLVAGVAVYLLAAGRVGRVPGFALVAACLAAHALQTLEVGTTIGVAFGIGAVCAAALGPDWDVVVPAVVRPGVRWLAGIGYGVYLMHQAAGTVVMRRLHDLGAGRSVQVLGMLATGIVLGWALTVWVERPAYRALTRLRDRMLDRRSPRPARR
ncbi:acyltransferase family protein [Streptomyces sp. SID3343]|uniref:acyltransferase family protein n=1 Tax=Streptomyces sp. SID3343 TaxID=2690260 RepID=UPI00136D70AA|nr:acyltransferase family protein [Streptomyces sp. SID3343]MYW05900.1 acyltransferase family protein [Streptomyces sp. SID3343]